LFKFRQNLFIANQTVMKSFIFDDGGLIRTSSTLMKYFNDEDNPTKLFTSKKEWEKRKSFFNIFANINNSDEFLEAQEKEANFWLEFFEHVLEYYLNIIPKYK
jgi:hypothetical protein